MKRLPFFLLLPIVLFAQAHPIVWSIPIPITSFEVGYGSSFSETLSISPADLQTDPAILAEFGAQYYIEGKYTLTFSVANDPSSATYPGYYEGEIYFGNQELCPLGGWGTRNGSLVTTVCPGPAYIVIDQQLPTGGPVQGNQPLAFSFQAPNWGLKFNIVSLTFTPSS